MHAPTDLYHCLLDVDDALQSVIPHELAHSLRLVTRWLDLTPVVAAQLVELLKSAADRNWGIDPRRSIALADLIIVSGKARGDAWTVALGTMALGDALKFVGSQQAAWDLLTQAGDQFEQLGDEVGWGRTWIGRLSLAAQLRRASEAFGHARRASEIFERRGETVRLLRLEMAIAHLHGTLDEHAEQMDHYQRALRIAQSCDDDAVAHEHYGIYNNMGLAALGQGDLRPALAFFQRACDISQGLHAESAYILCTRNIAITLSRMGRYAEALRLMNQHEPRLAELMPREAAIQCDRIECLLALNQFEEGRAIGEQTLPGLAQLGSRIELARTLQQVAIAAAAQGDFASAERHTVEAEHIYRSLEAPRLEMLARLRRAHLALMRDDSDAALTYLRVCKAYFGSLPARPHFAEILLIEHQSLIRLGHTHEAAHVARACADWVRVNGDMAERIQLHTVLGRTAEAEGRVTHALRRYHTALALTDRVQRELTVTLRPGFMRDKLDPLRHAFRLQLASGHIDDAFNLMERSRAHAILAYLSNHGRLKWPVEDADSRRLIESLNALRERHGDVRNQLSSARTASASVTSEVRGGAAAALQVTLATIEQQMRSITQNLYLVAGRAVSEEGSSQQQASLSQRLTQALGGDGLVSYFCDESTVHAFIFNETGMSHHVLPITPEQINRLLGQFERNVARALASTDRALQHDLARLAQVPLAALHRGLIAPLVQRLQQQKRLRIVPCGLLHAVPFSVLFDGVSYLLDQYELVLLPSAEAAESSSAAQPAAVLGPVRPNRGGTLIHFDAGRLGCVRDEVRAISQFFETEQWQTREGFQHANRAVLHVAAHGEHRLDQTDFSCIELADGEVFTDDILQLDLKCELVTLSACETARGRTAAHDDAFGLGWSFIYAGAKSVIASLWRVEDQSTAALMAALYQALSTGATKSQALRSAQLQIREQRAHPAFWGAFHLYGEAGSMRL